MRALHFLQYWLQTAIAALCVPFLRLFNVRFGKRWRGNWIVHHVAANAWADGYPVKHCRFFSRYI